MRHITTVEDHLQDVVDGNWKTGNVYEPFVQFCTQQGRVDLLEHLNDIIEAFANTLLKNLRERTEPYVPYYKAMELVDPSSTVNVITVEVRAAISDICQTHDIEDAVSVLRRMRRRINNGRPSVDSLITARQNILRWYANKVGLRQLLPSPEDRKTVKKFAMTVFSTNIVTAVVESVLGLHKHQKSKRREMLSDEASTIAVQCGHYPDVAGTNGPSTMLPLSRPSIDMETCFTYDYSSHHGGNYPVVDDDLTDSDVE